jgi:16S rRNA C967 or C1407 C5-methylase (RsmB/RsmF family)
LNIYKDIIPGFDAFKSQAEKDGPTTSVTKNSIKAQNSFQEDLEDRFTEVCKSSWNNAVYRLPEAEKPGNSMMHWRGEYYVQEESASVPIKVLSPSKKDKVLDACAAPGGKTVQIASKTDNCCELVSSDASKSRLSSLQSNIFRTGAACAKTVRTDARSIRSKEKFDKILVDAPCSGEGDMFYRSFEPSSRSETESLAKLQADLCLSLANNLKQGGKMVYSTCTISPLENEAVVEKVVENTDLSLIEASFGAEHENGVQRFDGRRFSFDVSKIVRVYPHHIGSGVIFVAAFRK